VARTSPTQKYCPECSERRDLVRKRLWARRNPPSVEQVRRRIRDVNQQKELARDAGVATSRAAASNIAWLDSTSVDLLWNVRIAVPFSWSASKNHIYTMRRSGHLALRREARQMRTAITHALRAALHCIHVAHNKVWIDILVQKPNHKGDAVNVVDLVCDAVKDAVGIDDRWFAIRRLDWEIVKDHPRLFVGIGQDSSTDCQICSYCGQIKAFSEFGRRKRSPLGIGRECRECRRQGRLLAKRQVMPLNTDPANTPAVNPEDN
jgi:uncharacterized Zn-finger protein